MSARKRSVSVEIIFQFVGIGKISETVKHLTLNKLSIALTFALLPTRIV